MKHSNPPYVPRRKSSTLHYQTFPTPPPKSKGQPPSLSPPSSSDGPRNSLYGPRSPSRIESPLPLRQLGILAVIALAEQTALNSISPYLPQMASTFPEVDPGQVGLYVGVIASSFALAQFATNFLWGWFSDRIGRKPVILAGTLFTAACFVAFGFCKNLWQAILVQAIMGLVNGNQGVVSTCLGEITDRSNQSRAFVYLPVIYGLGAITGPLLGGTLVKKEDHLSKDDHYPYLKPNIVSAVILLVDLVLIMFFLEESLEEARDLPPLGKRLTGLFSRVWQFASSSRQSYLRSSQKDPDLSSQPRFDGTNEDGEDDDSDTASQESMPALLPHVETGETSSKHILKKDTVLLLATFLIFQFSNISYNSLYPIFGQAAPPTGRNLSPEEIGVSLAFAGAVTIFFQIAIFGKLRDRMGNKVTYRITNSAPNHSVLGTLNGLAQTLSAAGRAVGPFLSGALFSAATHIRPKGEALAFGVFGGITFIGFLMSFGIRGARLEAEGLEEEEESDGDENDEHRAR
ncbi:MAG: hypothetical protein Q9167_000926 [Letrouitia subvulpina]